MPIRFDRRAGAVFASGATVLSRVRCLAAACAGLLLMLGLSACGRSEQALTGGAGVSAPAQEALRASPGNYLAYAHSATIRLAADGIAARLRETQAACSERRFGECVVLNVQQSGGDHPQASLGVRIVPEGVEPMIALAGNSAEIGARSTRAEDLAVAVRDNTLARTRLHKERERLQAFQVRGDLAVADMIALSRQLAEVESQLEATEQQAAQHRRRIETQLLTLSFQRTEANENHNEIQLALKESGATLALGVAWTIRVLAFLLPLLVLLAVIGWLARYLRRRRKG